MKTSGLFLLMTLAARAALAALPMKAVPSPFPYFGDMLVCALENTTVCSNPNYWRTECGVASLKAHANDPAWICRTAAHNASLASAQEGGATSATVLQPEQLQKGNLAAPVSPLPGSTRTAWVAPYPVSHNVTTGGLGTFRTRLLSTTPAARAAWNTPNTTPAGYTFVAKDPWPESDVSDCVEYAYEKYWDFSRLEEAATASNHDSRAIVNLVLTGTSGWGANGTTSSCSKSTGICTTRPGWAAGVKGAYRATGGVFRQRTGAVLPAIPMGFCRAKNAFREFGTPNPGASCHYTDSWAWHEQMNTALAGVSTEQLEYLQKVQGEYRATLDYKARLLAGGLSVATLFQCAGKPPVGACAPKPIPQDLLDGANKRLTQLEGIATAYGCFGEKAVTACDWAPSLLAERIYGWYRAARETDYRVCTVKVGTQMATLGTLFPVGHPSVGKWFRKNPAALETFYTDMSAWLAASLANVPKDPTTGKAKVRDTAVDTNAEDSDYFDISVQHNFYWGLNRRNGSADMCNVDGTVHAELAIDAVVFGQPFQALFTRFDANRTTTTFEAKVLGNDVFPPSTNPSFNQTWNLVNQTYSVGNKFKTPTIPIFSIAFVTIGVSGGVAYEVGLESKVDLTVAASSMGLCNTKASLGVKGNVTPFGFLEGFASVSIDLLIVEVGVKGVLRIVDARLPFLFDIGLQITNALAVTAKASLSAQLRLLSGALKVFACIDLFFWSDCVEETLVSWPGIPRNAQLFSVDWGSTPVALTAIWGDVP